MSVTHTFRRGVDIGAASTSTLRRELDYETKCLAEDLKACGSGYPSPLKPSIAAICAELARRGAL